MRSPIMSREALRFFAGVAAAALLLASAFALLPTPDAPTATSSTISAAAIAEGDFAVVGVRLFDGVEVLTDATVLVDDGTVVAVGVGIDIPAGTALVQGAGRTLLPGLIDAHVHAYGEALEQSARFGVTTVLDQFTDPELARGLREQQAAGQAQDRADLFSAGVLVTRKGGHGTQFGLQIPTLDVEPGDDLDAVAREFVAARLAEGSDWIKIVYDQVGDPSGEEAGRRPSLDRATVRAVIGAAHAAGKPALVHVSARDAAREVLEDGADGLVHVWYDEPIDDKLAALAKDRGAFVIPTLTVIESVGGTASGSALAADARLKPLLSSAALSSLRTPFAVEPDASRLEVALAATAALFKAGVPILAGTDAPNPGTAYGVSMLRELELLVRAGLTPMEALAAATSVPARAFAIGDGYGRIAEGSRADLLLVDGNATADVRALRGIVAVWKEGHLLAREPVREEAAESSLGPGVIGSFDGADAATIETGDEQGLIAADQGFGWSATTDLRAGGASTVRLTVSDGVLTMAGEVVQQFAYPWAGAIFFPGTGPMEPTDLSSVSTLALRARGDAGFYRLMLFSTSIGRIPVQRGFHVTGDWQEFEFDLEALGGERKDITALALVAGPSPAVFRLEIDDVTLR